MNIEAGKMLNNNINSNNNNINIISDSESAIPLEMYEDTIDIRSEYKWEEPRLLLKRSDKKMMAYKKDVSPFRIPIYIAYYRKRCVADINFNIKRWMANNFDGSDMPGFPFDEWVELRHRCCDLRDMHVEKMHLRGRILYQIIKNGKPAAIQDYPHFSNGENTVFDKVYARLNRIEANMRLSMSKPDITFEQLNRNLCLPHLSSLKQIHRYLQTRIQSLICLRMLNLYGTRLASDSRYPWDFQSKEFRIWIIEAEIEADKEK